MLLDIRNMLIALAVGLVVGTLGSWYLTAEYKDATWGKAVADQKVEAGNILQKETDKLLVAERKVTELNNQLEVNHAEANRKIDTTLADNRRLSRELGGMRDPGRRKSCDQPQAGVQPAADAAGQTTGAELSAEAEEFLFTLTADADRAAEYAGFCHSWANRSFPVSATAESSTEAAP